MDASDTRNEYDNSNSLSTQRTDDQYNSICTRELEKEDILYYYVIGQCKYLSSTGYQSWFEKLTGNASEREDR